MVPKLLLQRVKVLLKADCVAGAAGGESQRGRREGIFCPRPSLPSPLSLSTPSVTPSETRSRNAGTWGLTKRSAITEREGRSLIPPLAALAALFVFPLRHVANGDLQRGRREQKERGALLPPLAALAALFVFPLRHVANEDSQRGQRGRRETRPLCFPAP